MSFNSREGAAEASARAVAPNDGPARSLPSLLRDVAALTGRQTRLRALWILLLACVNTLAEGLAALSVVAFIQLVSGSARTLPTPFRQVLGAHGDWTHRRMLLAASVSLSVFYAAKNTLIAAQAALQAREANRMAAVTADRLFTAYIRSTAEEVDRRLTADVVRNVTTSTDSMLRQSAISLVNMVSDLLVLLVVIAVLVVKQPLVTPLAGLVILAMLVTAYLALRRRLDRLGADANAFLGRNIADIQNGLGAFREIRVLGREDYFLRQQRRSRDRLADARWRFDTYYQLPRLAFETVFVFALAAIVTAVSLREDAASDVVPLLALFAYAGFRLLPSVNRITVSLATLRYGADAIATVRRELAALEHAVKPATVRDVAETALPTGFEWLELRDVSYRYPGSDGFALQAVTLSILRGTQLGVVGSTGAGKSTLLDVVIGLARPTEGRIVLNGVDITDRPRVWQDMLGYVPQTPFLVEGSIRQNIALGVPHDQIDDGRIQSALELAQLSSFVASLDHGVQTLVGERGVRLSGGQRQRIAIARALYDDPAVLVFDEATSSLDYETERELTAAIASLAGQKTILVVAHRLSTVRDCEQIIMLAEGRVVAVGDFEGLQRDTPAFAALLRAGAVTGARSGTAAETEE